MSRKACDSYIQLHKKITNKSQIEKLVILADRWSISAQEVCYRLIVEGIFREEKKRKEYEEIIK